MKDIEHWKQEGFTFEARFTGEYDLWVNHKTMQQLRRYVDGREWISDLTTGEYALVQDTPNAAPSRARRKERTVKALVRQIWNPRPPLRCRLKVWWQRLWIRRDEFHRTLNADHDALLHMCDCERRRYWADIARRRGISHERALNMPNMKAEADR